MQHCSIWPEIWFSVMQVDYLFLYFLFQLWLTSVLIKTTYMCLVSVVILLFRPFIWEKLAKILRFGNESVHIQDIMLIPEPEKSRFLRKTKTLISKIRVILFSYMAITYPLYGEFCIFKSLSIFYGMSIWFHFFWPHKAF